MTAQLTLQTVLFSIKSKQFNICSALYAGVVYSKFGGQGKLTVSRTQSFNTANFKANH
jgi:hypothetical protein